MLKELRHAARSLVRVRGLLRPLANQDEDRLLRAGIAGPSGQREERGGLGDFSTLEFTLVGLGDPRVVRAGVVGGFALCIYEDDV